MLPPEHLNLFSRTSLTKELRKQGFAVLQTTTIGKSFTIQYIIQTLAHHLPFLNRWGALVRGTRLGLLKIPVNLHDNVFVLARKT
jgi:hypothetical protein